MEQRKAKNGFRVSISGVSLALLMGLSACGGNGSTGKGSTQTAPTSTAAATPSRNVSTCLNQTIPGTNGATPASLVIPDTLKLNMANPAGFPNGRRLQDPAPDITLAVLLLDLTKHSPATFANLPLNPAANDRPFSSEFPFLAPPQGTPPLATGTGTSFNFRNDPLSSYVRVDREGMPAVSAALIGSVLKNTYNDVDPVADSNGIFVEEITAQLTNLHNGIADDLIALGLVPCSK